MERSVAEVLQWLVELGFQDYCKTFEGIKKLIILSRHVGDECMRFPFLILIFASTLIRKSYVTIKYKNV